MNDLNFETRRFVVRPYRMSDYENWTLAHRLTLPKQNAFDEKPKSRRELTKVAFRKLLKRYNKYRKQNVIMVMAAFDKDSRLPVGEVLISLIVRFNVQSARISYVVFNNNWRMGYGFEITQGLIHFAIHELKLNRLEAEVELKNKASIALAKKLGMRFEGRRKQAVYFDRRWHDHFVFAITARDLGFVNRKPKIR